jgi:hypothetical protein
MIDVTYKTKEKKQLRFRSHAQPSKLGLSTFLLPSLSNQPAFCDSCHALSMDPFGMINAEARGMQPMFSSSYHRGSSLGNKESKSDSG